MPITVHIKKLAAWQNDLPDQIKVEKLNEVAEDFAQEIKKEIGSLQCQQHPEQVSHVTVIADRHNSMVIQKKCCCPEFEKKVNRLMEFLDVMRSKIGYDIPMGTDHWGHFGVNEAIKICRAAEKYNLAYIEDIIPWHFTKQWREITESTTTPTQTGEDIFGLEGGFKELIDTHAVDIVHPDPNTAGGILETKRIGDYASANGIGFMHHHAAGPVSFLGSVHSAAATENFLWLEHHAVDQPRFDDLVTGIEKPLVQNGYVKVPEKPGIGVELNEDVVKEFLVKGEKLFAPTPEWNEIRAWDRLWS